jgi:hypothetical protein
MGYSAAPQPQAKRTTGEAITDVGAGLVSGIGSLVQLPSQLYGLATGDFSNTGLMALGKGIEKQGEEWKSEALKQKELERAAKIKEAEKQGFWEEFKTGAAETLKDPALLTSFLAEQAPQLLGSGLIGKGVKGAVLGRELAKGATKEAAEATAIKAGVKAGVGTGAVQQGADIGTGTYEETYDELIKRGTSPDQAKAEALGLARASGASGAIISLLAQKLPGAKTLEESFVGAKGTTGRLLGAGKGLLGEAASEAAEEGGGKFTQNLAMREVNPETELMKGVGTAAGLAAIGGGAFGTVGGALKTPAHANIKTQDLTKEEAEPLKTEQGQLLLPRPDEILTDSKKYDPVMNPMGNFADDDLKDILTPAQIAHIKQDRINAGKPKIDTYSIEDVYDALKNSTDTEGNPLSDEAQKGFINQLLTVKSGYTPASPASIDSVMAMAESKNIETGTQGFKDFLTRVTGTDRLNEMEGPQLYAAWKSLSELPKSEQPQILPQGTNAIRFSEKQYSKSLSGLETAFGEMGDKPLSPTSVKQEIKDFSGLERDADVDAMYRAMVERGDIEVSYPPVKTTEGIKNPAEVRLAGKVEALPSGLDIRHQTFKQGEEPEAFEVRNGKHVLISTHATMEEAQKEVENQEKINAPLVKTSEKAISNLQKFIEKNDAELARDRALGYFDTDAYKNKAALFSKKNKAAKAAIKHHENTILNLTNPWNIVPSKKTKPVVKKKHVLYHENKPVAAFEKKEHAEEVGLRNLDDKTLEQIIASAPMTKGTLPKRYAAMAEKELARRRGEAPKGIEVQRSFYKDEAKEKADELAKTLIPALKKFGLENVGLRIVNSIRNGTADGEWAQQVITIAMDAKNPMGTLRHESIHALKELGAFTDAEWKVLENKAKGEWVQRFIKDTGLYDQYKEEYKRVNKGSLEGFDAYINEEAIAEAFKFFEGNKPPAGMIGNIFYRLSQMMQAIRNAFNGAGFKTADSIFSGIEEGAFKPTTVAAAQENAPKYSRRKIEEVKSETEKENGKQPTTIANGKELIRGAIQSYRRRNEATLRTHEGESVRGSGGVRVLGVKPLTKFSPTKDFNKVINDLGIQSPDLYELGADAAPKFQEAITSAKESNPFGAAVTVYPVEDYGNMRMFVTEDGNAGFALKGNDIVSVFSQPPHKGTVNSMIQLAVQEGGRKLDAFDTVLPQLYHNNGFKVVSRMKWNEEYKPENWDKKTFSMFNKGEPDVVFMAYDPQSNAVPSQSGEYFTDYDEAVNAQDKAVGNYNFKFDSPALKIIENRIDKPAFGKKATVNDVGAFFDKLIKDEFGEALKYTDPVAFKRAVALATEEMNYQMGTENSGLDWYEKDIKDSFTITARAIPALRQEQKRQLFSIMAGIMSPQTNARDNWFIAAKAFEHYLETGKIPKRNPEGGGLWQGGTQSANKEVQLNALNNMVKELGERKTLEWLLSSHTVKEINDFRMKYGNVKSGIAGKATDIVPGLYMFGPKVGPFVGNLNGIHDVTVDKWMTRTFNRYFGTMVDANGDIVDSPTEAQRTAVKQLINEIAKNANIQNYQAQSVLWFFEQKLFRELGTPAPSYGFSDGARKFAEQRGVASSKPRVRSAKEKAESESSVRLPESAVRPSEGSGGGITLSNNKQEDAVTFEGIHYGNVKADELDASKFGTGLRGAESRRLADAFDERIKRRVYFYIAKPTGEMPTRESGVGSNVYTQTFNNILGQGSKMSRLYSEAMGDSNNFESAIIDAGYDGYAIPEMGMMVVLNHNVPVNYEGTVGELTESGKLKNGKIQRFSLRAPETPAFKQWFGNSKIVNPDGTPKVMYHGTARDISVFKPKQAGAIFLTSNPKFAKTFSETSDTYIVYEKFKELPLKLKEKVMKQALKLAKGNGVIDPYNANYAMQTALTDGNLSKYGIDWHLRKFMEPYLDTGENIMPFFVRAEKPFDYSLYDEDGLDALLNKNTKLKDKYTDEIDTRIFSMIADGSWKEIEKPSIQNRLRDLGFDSFYVMEGGQKNLAVYDPSQIKSATGNQGTYDINNPDIRYSIKGEALPSDVEQTGRRDNLIFLLQDKQIDLKRIIDGIKKQGKELADKWNAYLQEELFHGRSAARVKYFIDRELQPLLRKMASADITLEQMDDYLLARHAKEANAYIRKINKDPNANSGMTDQQADAFMNAMTVPRRQAFERLAKEVDAMTKQTRQMMVDYGLESQKTIDTWEKTYKTYVPLFREETEGGAISTGRGYNIRGSTTRQRTGSSRGVVDVLANIALQRERTIARGEKNRVGNALLGLILQNPDKNFWTAIRPDEMSKDNLESELLAMGLSPDVARNLSDKPKERILNTATGEYEFKTNPLWLQQPNIFITRVNGEDRIMAFNQDNERASRMAVVFNNLDSNQKAEAIKMMGTAGEYFDKTINGIGTATRYFAAVNTQYNPAFSIFNFLRDVGGATLNLQSTPLKGKEREVIGNSLTALKEIYKDLRLVREGKQATSKWGQIFEEFELEGGKTGFRDLFNTSEERAKALQSELDAFKQGGVKVKAKAVFDWLSDFNEAVENSIRVSAYKTALDQGMSKAQAASLAKNLTVNFNRTGAASKNFTTFYAFFNASVQGSARIAQTLMSPDGKLTNVGKMIVKGGISVGIIQAVLLAMAGFEDDEPPDFVKDKNFVIPYGDKKYIAIPMPLGFNVFPSFGRRVAEFAMSDNKNVGKAVFDMGSMIMDAFNPLGSATFAQTLAPTLVDPIVALAENKDFSGKPISKDDLNSLNPTPGYTRAKDNASAVSTGLAYAINFLSGGTDFKKGVISPTPDQIDYLIGQVTGGVGREILKVEKTVGALASGEELATFNVPVIGRMIGDVKQKTVETSRFYDNIKVLNEHQHEIEGRIKSGQDLSDYFEEHPEAGLFKYADKTYNKINEMKRTRKTLKEQGVSDSDLKDYDEAILALMMSLNEAVREVKATR